MDAEIKLQAWLNLAVEENTRKPTEKKSLWTLYGFRSRGKSGGVEKNAVAENPTPRFSPLENYWKDDPIWCRTRDST
jgi:hypothetical protein